MWEERNPEPSHDGRAVLDIGADVGALLAHTTEALAGQELEVSTGDAATARIHTLVRERRAGGRRFFAALFPALTAGRYTLWHRGRPVSTPMTIVGGEITEITVTGSSPFVRPHPEAHRCPF